MPASLTVQVEWENRPDLARLVLALELGPDERRYRITRLEATPPPGGGIDRDRLRLLDLPGIIRAGVAHLVVLKSKDGETFTAERPLEGEQRDPLLYVALVYSVAYAIGENPTAAVADALNISRDAAAQRVKRARDAQYLPPTSRGRAS